MGLEREVYLVFSNASSNKNPRYRRSNSAIPFFSGNSGPSVRAVVALGTFAAQTLLKPRNISKLRGIFDYHGIHMRPIRPSIRNASMKREVWGYGRHETAQDDGA
jgi:uracil-DNA glycosylase